MKDRFQNIVFVSFLRYTRRRFSKLFYFFLFFFIVQVLLLVLKLEVTPFFLYGMYSEKVPASNIYKTTTVYADEKDIATLNFSAREADLLLTGIDNYLALKNNQGIDVVQTRVETRYPFFTNSVFYPPLKSKIYNSPQSVALFESWFKQKCNRLTPAPVDTISVVANYYQFLPAQTALKPIKTELLARF